MKFAATTKFLSVSAVILIAGFLFTHKAEAIVSDTMSLSDTNFEEGTVGSITLSGNFHTEPFLATCGYGPSSAEGGYYPRWIDTIRYDVIRDDGYNPGIGGSLNNSYTTFSYGAGGYCPTGVESGSPARFTWNGVDISVGSLPAGNYRVYFSSYEKSYDGFDNCYNNMINNCQYYDISYNSEPYLTFVVTEPPPPSKGTVRVISNLAQACWNVSGPTAIASDCGSGTHTYQNLDMGTYTLSPVDVACYDKNFSPANITLSSDGQVSDFTLTYTANTSCVPPDYGTINVVVQVDGVISNNFTTCWNLNGPTGTGACGSGTHTYTNRELGFYTLSADDFPCYTKSISPANITLSYNGQNETFYINYSGCAPVSCTPASQTVAIGQTVNFNASGGYGSYSWSAPGGTPSSGGNSSSFSTSYGSVGNYTVTLTRGTVGTCSVIVAANPAVLCSPTNQSVDINTTVNFIASGGSGTYSWASPGGSPTTGGNSASFATSYSTAGIKTVTVTRGSTSSDCTVYVSAPQTIVFNITYTPNTLNTAQNVAVDNSVCERLTVTWTYTANGSEDGLKVYRSTDNSNWTWIGPLQWTGNTFYQDTPPTSNTTYYYRIGTHRATAAVPTEVYSASASAFNNPCIANLSPSSMTISKVNGANFSGATKIKEGDVLTYQITIINNGPSNATINYICVNPSDSLVSPTNLQVSGSGSSNGGIVSNNATCISAGHSGLRFSVTGTKDINNNWIITYNTTFQSTSDDPQQAVSNTVVIYYTDGSGLRYITRSAPTLLISTDSSGAPTFREVAP
jgi:uncharacterized repeat protein (TIGR01451 family)